eukprot:m51a1_g9345 putative tyrosine-protein kinase txk (575) ;mRNA; r:76212-80746
MRGDPRILLAARVRRLEPSVDASPVRQLSQSSSSGASVGSIVVAASAPGAAGFGGEHVPLRTSWETCDCIVSGALIEKEIGEGAFGKVYLVSSHLEFPVASWHGNQVAAKKSKRDLRTDREFLSEASMWMKVRFPNCVAFYGVQITGNFAYLLCEYMPSGSLLSFLKMYKGRIDLSRKLSFAKDCASGMLYLSGCGIVHRDLAARNVLIKPEGESNYVAKIADYGLSRTTTVLSSSGSTMASYHAHDYVMPFRWSAPECLEQRMFTAKSDVWSFGVLLWEIFTEGETPYNGLENKQVLGHLKTGQRLDRPQVAPQPLWELMKRSWEWDPDSRPTFVDIHTAVRCEMSETTSSKLEKSVWFNLVGDRKRGHLLRSEDTLPDAIARMPVDFIVGILQESGTFTEELVTRFDPIEATNAMEFVPTHSIPLYFTDNHGKESTLTIILYAAIHRCLPRKYVHGALCDGCNKSLRANMRWYHCTVCRAFDLCCDCYEKLKKLRVASHYPEHETVLVRGTVANHIAQYSLRPGMQRETSIWAGEPGKRLLVETDPIRGVISRLSFLFDPDVLIQFETWHTS